MTSALEKFKAAASEAVTSRTSGRKKPINLDAFFNEFFYIVEPQYQAAKNPKAGGVHSAVVLGPGAPLSTKSDSQADLPKAMEAAKERYGKIFISGHLLNAVFGGNGKVSANVTILTESANSQNKGFDENIIKALACLRKVYIEINKLGIDVRGLKYGIALDIQVDSTTWGVDAVDSCISTGVTCSAKVVGTPTLDEDAVGEEPVTDWKKFAKEAEKQMEQVEAFVAAANENGRIENTKPS